VARTGRFGRQPRSAQSLTNTLVAIAREFQRTQDQNLMDAWQKGGTVNGGKVTDAMVLKHWKDRMEGVSKDDPLYDTYKNASRAARLHDPRVEDDGRLRPEEDQRRGHGRVLPRLGEEGPEGQRVLPRPAARRRPVHAAAAQSQQDTKAAAEAKYRAQMTSIEKKWERPGQQALNFVTMLAQRGAKGGTPGGGSAVLGEQPLGNISDISDRTNIADLELPSIDEMMNLLGQINVEGPLHGAHKAGAVGGGTGEVLFHDESGQPVTGKDILARLSALDPTFDGTFDVNSIREMMSTQKEGLAKRIALAKKTGHISEMQGLQTQMARVNEYGNEIAAWPVTKAYSDLKMELDGVMKDDTLLPAAKASAIDRIRTQIGKLADDPRIAADDHMQSQLRGEATGTAGTVTLSEDMEGLKNGFTDQQSASNSEVMNIEAIREQLKETNDLINNPESGYVLTQGNYVRDATSPTGTKFEPATGGKAVGPALSTDVANLPGAGTATVVMVPNGDGGGSTPLMVVPAPITASATKADGTNMKKANANPVGSFIRFNVNGVETTLYGLKGADNVVRWTADPPWDQTKFQVDDSGGSMKLSFKADAVPHDDTTGATGGPVPGFPGFSIEGKSGVGKHAAQVGELVFDPSKAVLGTDQARQAAGPNTLTDSFSPTLVALKATPDGQALLRQYASDPKFAQIIQNDAHRAAGMNLDLNTGVWTGTPQQQSLYNGFVQNGQDELAKVRDGITTDAHQALGPDERDNVWERNTTQTDMQGAPGHSAGGTYAPLPTDALRSSADERFAHMYGAFKPGTAAIAPPKPEGIAGGIEIKQPIGLTVPTFQTPTVNGPTVAPVNPVAPPPPKQQSYTPPSSYTPPPSSSPVGGQQEY
jgi:hypothetical protein